MFQKDYILRLIEQFIKILARVLKLREQGQHEQAIQEISEAYRTLLGLSAEMVHSLSEEQLREFLHVGARWNPERCEVLAALLKEEGENLVPSGRIEDAAILFAKSLSLYLEIPHKAEPISDLIEKLKDFRFSNPMLRKLFRYYERMGCYDVAENILFELAECGEPKILDQGREFYERLKRKTPTELKQGNLPLEEIEEGLQQLEKMLSQ